ncbi:hypothetical protein F0562_005329 [Nyssa sinensis]|uniref:Exocyst subunit Exo70 family protein n=1 Tax=Nyssa sinensis TaxID=561372 RepID=A0A5J5AMS1_9ASTE|nr:hypothetical protein F0562_005329 [Nyssa sinensis]
METSVSHSEFSGSLLSRFNNVVIEATSVDLSSTIYSSSMSSSTGPSSFQTRANIRGRGSNLAKRSDDFWRSPVNEILDQRIRGGSNDIPTMEDVDNSELLIGSAITLNNQGHSKTNDEIRLESQLKVTLTRVEGMNQSSITGSNWRPDFNLLDEDHICSYGALPEETIYELRSIAETMKSTGQLFQCVTIYARVRKSFLDTSFRRLGIEKLSIKEVRVLEWVVLEAIIKRWIKAAKICIRILFVSERKQSEQIFGSQIFGSLASSMDDACFAETVRDAATQLFDIAEALNVSYVFQSQSVGIIRISESIRIGAAQILSRLAEAASVILPDFENSVLHELSPPPVPGETIHTLTKYVMDYVSLILDKKEILTKFITIKPSTDFRDMIIPYGVYMELEGRTPLALHLIRIIVFLRFNLGCKSKRYVEASLAHLFIMNNVDYIVSQMEGSPKLQEMVGDDYIKVLAEDVQKAASSYQKLTLDRILYCLRDDGLEGNWWGLVSGVSKSSLKERVKTFNSMFEEIHHTQERRAVPNLQLQEKLRLSILEKLIPAYESFLSRFSKHIESGKHQKTCIKYSVKDVETAVMNFFAYQIFL